MVKPDYTRDYYADLELQSTADVQDIKKQFKKLALKWHPDRNPGKEDQAKDRFLVIQAAHEILTDPPLKAKYDAQRRRLNPFGTASGVKGNPYQNVSQDMSDRFGAPPTRRRPPPPARPTPSPYSTWGVPQQPKPKQGDASENLRAWDRMRSTSARQVPTAGAKPTRPAGSTESGSPQPPRTAYQARNTEASFGTRRTGFAPTSTVGDEPPVKSQHYTNMHANVFAETAANLKKSRPPSGNVDPLSEQFKDTFLDTRQSTPYASHVGEKTNPFEGASPSRAKDVRDSWRRFQEFDDEDSPTPPERQRSASVGEADGLNKPAAKENNPFFVQPERFFSSQASARYSPRPVNPNNVPPNATFASAAPASSTSSVGSSTNATVNGGASQSGSHNVYEPSPIFQPARSQFPFPGPAQKQSQPSHPSGCANGGGAFSGTGFPEIRVPKTRAPEKKVPAKRTESDSEVPSTQEPSQGPGTPFKKSKHGGAVPPSGEAASGGKLNAFERTLQAQIQQLLANLKENPDSFPRGIGSSTQQGKYRTNSTDLPSFTVPDDEGDVPIKAAPGSQQARFMRHSTESINTRFAAEEKPGANYQFNAGGPSATEDAFLRAKQRSRSTPRGRRSSPHKGGFANSADASTNSNGQQDTAQENQKENIFDPEKWAAEIGPHHFVPPPVPPKQSTSPTRRPVKKPKPVRMTAGTAGMVDDEETSGEDKPHSAPAPAPAPSPAATPDISGAPSPNAMDIDPPPAPPTTAQVNGARTINVEPSKPEWRAGVSHGAAPGVNLNSPNGPAVPKPNLNAAGSEDTTDFVFTEFQKVEPFAPKPAGLASFGDLKFNLPFESKPSTRLPFEKDDKPRPPLAFPPAPACPNPPAALAFQQLRPNASSWEKYQRDFAKYLEDFAAFEKKIVDHFVARQRVGEAAGEKRFAWTATRGDEAGNRYLRDVEQDQYVRKKWAVAVDQHELRVKEFSKYRERMKQYVSAAP